MPKRLVLTIDADDDTLVRIATILCYANLESGSPTLRVVESPGDDDGPQLVVSDPEHLRKEAVRRFSRYVEQHGPEAGRALLTRYDAPRLSQVRNAFLGALVQELSLGGAI